MAKAAKRPNCRQAKKVFKNIPYGQAHIYATFNNSIVSLTDQSGNVVTWASAGTSAPVAVSSNAGDSFLAKPTEVTDNRYRPSFMLIKS